VPHPSARDPKHARVFVVVSRQILLNSRFSTVNRCFERRAPHRARSPRVTSTRRSVTKPSHPGMNPPETRMATTQVGVARLGIPAILLCLPFTVYRFTPHDRPFGQFALRTSVVVQNFSFRIAKAAREALGVPGGARQARASGGIRDGGCGCAGFIVPSLPKPCLTYQPHLACGTRSTFNGQRTDNRVLHNSPFPRFTFYVEPSTHRAIKQFTILRATGQQTDCGYDNLSRNGAGSRSMAPSIDPTPLQRSADRVESAGLRYPQSRAKSSHVAVSPFSPSASVSLLTK
jgi:hypothetical protein